VRKSAYAHEKEAADSSAKEQQQQQRSRQQTEPPISPFVNQFREMQVFDKMRNRLRSMGTYADFLKCVLAFNIGAITKMELECLAYDLVGKQSDLYSNFSELMVRCESLDSDEVSKKEGRLTQEDIPKMKSVHGREQYLRTPTSELDLTACQKAGESYRLLPQEFPRAPAKGRTYLCNRVLNEDWVNVTSGSEDYSYKAMRKNQYEEALFRCEDDRFELDMVIETNKSAIACLEELSEHLEERFSDRRRTKPLDPAEIGSVQLRAIERIYGDCKHELRDKLFRHPLATVPVVLQRLKQKLEEWQKLQQEMQSIWAKVYEKNYSRSLDHRSFYFKQEDKRALSQKELLREVHDRARARRCGSIGSAISDETADMAFVDQYRATHDDAYAILRHYLSLQMQPQDVEKMLWFWRSFVERFYNVIRPNDGSPLYDSLAHQSIEGASTRAKEGESLDTEAHERHDGSTPEGYRGTRSPAPLEDGQQPTPQEPGSPSDDENADDAEGKQYQRPRSLHQQQWQQDEQQEQDTEYFDQNEEGMQEGEDEEQEDEEDGAGRYTGCKPIAPRLVDSRPVQKGVSPNQGSKEIFFGHDAFYILFKLHHLLLQRLAVARDSASQADKASWKSEEANETEGPHSERDVLTHFFELLSSLLSSTIDTTTYEDDCRTLLGAKSYVLFTLDRLVQKIYKQLQTLVADDTSVKLAMLHEYETSRSVEFNQMVYQSNACMLLGQEDTCYWMSMVKRARFIILPSRLLSPRIALTFQFLHAFLLQTCPKISCCESRWYIAICCDY
jgi:paired amphipathic helix protein Sin3a